MILIQGIFFKQRYKCENIKSWTNQRKLLYISTRPGVICNPNCDFGLFGNGINGKYLKNIYNLADALNIIGGVSSEHTVYDCVISVDDETAKEKGLYDREAFQELVKSSLSVIQKEMDIDRQDFRWFASYHYKAGHPHIHLMYWDNSNKPRMSFVPKNLFKIQMESIRAGFNRQLFQEELTQDRQQKDEAKNAAKDILKSILKSVNSIEPLNLDAFSENTYMKMGADLYRLADSLPRTGALKYKYLPPGVKKEVNAYIDELLKLPIFKKVYGEYLSSAISMSEHFGNSKETTERNTEKAKERLYTDLGNILLKEIKENNYIDKSPSALKRKREELMKDIFQYLQINPRFGDKYHEVLKMFPERVTPIKEFADEEFNKKISEMCQELLSEPHIAEKMKLYAGFSGKLNTEILEYEQILQDIHDNRESPGAIRLPENTHQASQKTFYKEAYSDIFKETRKFVFDMLYQNSGYPEKYQKIAAMNLMIDCFHCLSQFNNHSQQCSNQYVKNRSLSKQAKRDWHKRHQDSKMEFEWEQ